MRLTIPQQQFLKQLQIVERAVNDRSTLPILSTVLIQNTKEELVLTATDLDVGIQCRFPLTLPAEEGSVTLPARKLTTIVRELPDETVTLEAKKNLMATLECGAANFRIPGLPVDDFPIFPEQGADRGIVISQGALKALASKTSYAMSMEETRFILNGTLLTTDKDVLTFVATDGRRLALASSPTREPATKRINAILPAKTIRELGRLLSADDTNNATISPLKDNQLSIRFGGVTIITRLLDGQFPPYEKVIPAASKTKLLCDKGSLLTAVRRIGLMTTAASQAVVFELDGERLVISKESADLGSAREELRVSYNGARMAVAFNPEYWLDVLKTLDVDDVCIELSGPDRPAVIRQQDFTYLVLPMKLS